MKLFKILIFFDILLISKSLAPKRLPNGKKRIFVPNFEKPELDLKILSVGETSIICKNWMSNILLSVPMKSKSSDKINCDDIHIISSIVNLNLDESDKLHFGWNPYCLQGFNEVLFIVSVKLDKENKIMQIENLIQSPFWDSEQIESIFLKKSLISLNNSTNLTKICFDKLYLQYPRYQLAWENWIK